jgi:hypothetical protein
MDPLQIKFANEVLYSLLTTQKKRLENSVQKRNALMASIDRGENPTGYRADFLRDSAKRVLMELASIAKDFNDAHPDDRCTAQDFVDILNTTILWIKRKTG